VIYGFIGFKVPTLEVEPTEAAQTAKQIIAS
jgi:hypothetical protein